MFYIIFTQSSSQTSVRHLHKIKNIPSRHPGVWGMACMYNYGASGEALPGGCERQF